MVYLSSRSDEPQSGGSRPVEHRPPGAIPRDQHRYRFSDVAQPKGDDNTMDIAWHTNRGAFR
jgi:hypothetical protein